MPQPPQYDRQYNFSNYQALNPSEPIPANQVDIEFNEIKQTLDAILQNLSLIQRDDGELANDTVGNDQISAAVSLGFDAPVEWTPNTVFALTSTVFHDGVFYRAASAHTSGETFDENNWFVVADFTIINTDPGIRWTFSDSTNTGADPGDGYLAFNNADPSIATAMAISKTGTARSEDVAPDVSGWLEEWGRSENANKGYLLVKKAGNSSKFISHVVVSISDQTDYYLVTLRSDGGAVDGSFANDEAVNVEFVPAGERGTSAGIAWDLDAASTDTSTTPGVGEWRANNATIESATELAFDDQSAEIGNPDFSGILDRWAASPANPKGYLFISKAGRGDKRIEFDVTEVTADSGFYRVTVANGARVGTFADGDSCSIQFVRSADTDITNAMARDFANATGVVTPDLLDAAVAGGLIDIGFSFPWDFSALPNANWLYRDGSTIGKVGSGADHEDDDYRTLFDLCKAEAGLGNAGTEDFDAGDTVALPDSRGVALYGRDNMGQGAANRLQKSTTINTTSSLTTATVASATDLCVGMFVLSANVPAGTLISAISGTTLTLSQAATATASGTAARFSIINDPQVAGSVGGAQTIALILAMLAAHSHGDGSLSWNGSVSGSVSPNPHDHRVSRGDRRDDKNAASSDGSTFWTWDQSNFDTDSRAISWSGSVSGSISGNTASSGGGQPHPNVGPGAVTNWIILAKKTVNDIIPIGLGNRYYRFSTAISEAAPGDGYARVDNADLASATEIYIDDDDFEGNDLEALLLRIGASDSVDKGEFQITNLTQRGKFAVFRIDAAASDQTGYVKLAVTYITGSGTDSFAQDDRLALVERATGDKGNRGLDPGVRWDFDISTTMADPGTGDVRFNNAALASVSEIAVSATSAEAGGPDVSDLVASWDDSTNSADRGRLVFKKISAPGTFAAFKIVSAVTDNTGWLRFDVSYVTSSGSFSDADGLVAEFSPSGNVGAAGGSGGGAASTVRAATTGNITISTALNNGDTLDGVTLVTGDYVLVKDQSASEENGVYEVGTTPARATEFASYDQHPGVIVTVQEGNANADRRWLCTSNTGGTLDTTAIAFREVNPRIGSVWSGFRLTLPDECLACDGLTIGNGSSGGTSRANDDTWPLFEYLWDIGNTNGTLSIYTSAGAGSTFGADAATDFAANKRLALPDVHTSNKHLRPADGTNIGVGEVQTDGAPDIDGTFGNNIPMSGSYSGAFSSGGSASNAATAGSTYPREGSVTFAASGDDPTYSADEVRVNAIGVLVGIYYR
ncbi:hypothetical protein [Methyloceanibacter caenitepidi]|uniref:Phage tail fiber protein n=1 Tax=Methyloceanibacter caenitepidi TaxID=1384459 RepID=A0A0A8JZ57_9HYPH|nr:hypothetical protein [Methyloceanibacter caenitepidi]BAQ16093.1 hypothetical protein GL4_0630 [Methyloceanibacter caenitepidi]